MTDNESNESRTRAGKLGRFLGYVKERRTTVGNNLHITASQINARPLVQPAYYGPQPNYNGDQGGNGPQLAPDPIRQGMFDGVGRVGIARIPVVSFKYDQTAWESQAFATSNGTMRAGASIIGGRQTPGYERANIGVPDAVAYGSMFEYTPVPYGYV